jgi:hypothetical protein
VSDHFFDEADELLSFAGMLEGEQQFDYNILSGDSRSLGMDATNATNALDAQQGSKETSSTILVSDGAHNYNESKPTCSSNPDTIDNLIVPDLNTLLSNLQLAPASEIAYFYLQDTLGLEPEVMWKITNTAGSVLGFTVQNRELLKFPRLMTHSLFKIKHVVGYLRYQLGMDANEVKRILYQAPQVISLNTDDTLVSKVSFLRDFFALENGTPLRKVIAGMPTLLLCNVENNLKPKAQYLLEQFGGDEFKLRKAILTLPTLLGYSLEKRIRPRMARILEVGVEPIKITVGVTMTNDNFEKWLHNKRLRIQNGGYLVDTRRSQKKEQIEKSAKRAADDDLEAQQRSGRIVHWKR